VSVCPQLIELSEQYQRGHGPCERADRYRSYGICIARSGRRLIRFGISHAHDASAAHGIDLRLARAETKHESVGVRLFIAVMPSEEVVEHLDDAVQRLRRLRRSEADVRWVSTGQWHVTLVFIGEVDREVADELMPALDDVMAHCQAPQLQLAGAGSFGSKVLYLKVVDPLTGVESTSLSHVASRARDVVLSRNVSLEARPFQPHLTLARARGGRAGFASVDQGLQNYRGPSWSAGNVVLVQSESRPRSGGADVVHRVLSTSLVGPSR